MNPDTSRSTNRETEDAAHSASAGLTENREDGAVELESIRGIAAISVVLFHMPQWNYELWDIAFIRRSYLMVDLFFVLSGYVIYTAYGDNLRSLGAVARFQFLRFGRLYPVHLVFLSFFVMIEFAKLVFPVSPHAAFSDNSLSALVEQLFLVHALGFSKSGLTYNSPSWSISVEFYTYLIFAVVVLISGKRNPVWFTLLFLVSFTLIALNEVDPFGAWASCVSGFSLGCVVSYSRKYRFNVPVGATEVSLISILAFMLFVKSNRFDLLIIPLSAAMILAVVRSRGGVLREVLRSAVGKKLGERSYSIYMSHYAILWISSRLVNYASNSHKLIDGTLVAQLNPIRAVLCEILVLMLVYVTSTASYRYVEQPLRLWSRRFANAFWHR